MRYKKRMVNVQIPENAVRLIRENGIEKEDILSACAIDLSFAGRYIKGFILLTKEFVAVIESESLDDMVMLFRGTKVKEDEVAECVAEYKIKLYRLEDAAHIRLERMIATNYVYVTYRGVVTRLCAFTNTCIEQMNTFIKDFRKAKNEPDALEDEKQHEEDIDESEKYCPVCGTMYPDPERKICPKCMNKRSVFVKIGRAHV